MLSLKALDGHGLIQSMEEGKSTAQAACQVCLDAAAVIFAFRSDSQDFGRLKC